MTSFLQGLLVALLLATPAHSVIPDDSAGTDDVGSIDDWMRDQLDHGDQLVANFLSSEESESFNVRLLEEGGQRGYFKRCGDDTPCISGLECRNSGVGGKRCMPTEGCLQEHFVPLQERFNRDVIIDEIFADAGISVPEFLANARNASTRKAIQEVATSSPFRTVLSSIQSVFKSTGFQDEFTRAVEECFVQAEQVAANNDNSTRQFDARYIGGTLEIGLGGQASWSYMQAEEPSTGLFNRLCLGGGPKVGGFFTPIFGVLSGSSNIDDLACASLMGDVDLAPIPFPTLSIAGGIGFNGVPYVEASPCGLGLGIGAAANFCVAWRCE
ncbi:unknown protein [Seminavis robusta]|uniref:Uncharacterized protein n=1 Tax=Seminavis robusta TaxID=568900 RepID=A0A9N8H7B2_9STRA|nr:unknown protein [Seminavis robusta]|eukprot:Sro136_g064020.1 n/a (327) ;mRNA; r:31369-32349